ncbi:GPI-anchored surface protein, putative [Bodo saltans]|uniref:GPI-anchored surface protein, putative n=1 Tax=Bodo saltans TaxID=75058 RepID=A0A0S4JK32_BODSA|nr:GPI-anchored surface protein, putative [Bodo saltans]|eukprot:CUG90619.1 GPI-anchored surface protein, putative [Bodo saltans]
MVGCHGSGETPASIRLASTSGVVVESPQLVCTFNDLRTFVLKMLLSKQTAGGREGVGAAEPGALVRGLVCPMTVTKSRTCKTLYHALLLRILSYEERDPLGASRTKILFLGAMRTKSEYGAKIRVVDGDSLEVLSERSLPIRMGNIVSMVGAVCRHTKNIVKLVFVGTADGSLQAFDVDSGLRRQKLSVSCRSPWLSMLELNAHNMLFGGDSNGSLQIWNLSDIAKHVFLPDMSLTSLALVTTASVPMMHRGAITALTADGEAHLLFTAGLDLMICQYCTRTFTKMRRLQGHRQMIRTLAFCRAENVLISSGTEHMVYMWPLEMMDCVPQLVSVPSHQGTTQVAILEGTGLAVSMDVHGTFVVWDLRLAQWVGFVSCEPELTFDDPSCATVEWSAFAWEPVTKSFVCNANRKVYYLAYNSAPTSQNTMCAHDEGKIARGATFHVASRTFLSCAGTALQVWDVERAKSRHVLPSVAKSDVHSMALLEEEGILALGRDAGTVQFVVVNTFRRIAEYTSSTLVDAIVDIQPLSGIAPVCVACATKGGSVEIVTVDTETNQTVGLALRRSSDFTAILKATCLGSLNGKNLLIGEPGNRVSVWTFQRKKLPGDFSFLREGPPAPLCERDCFDKMLECHDVYTALSFPAPDDTTAVVGIPPGNVFVSGDSGGKIHVWAFGGTNNVAWPLAHFPSRRYNSLIPRSIVRSLLYCLELGLLYTGDDTGCVSVFDFSSCIPTRSESSVVPITSLLSMQTGRTAVGQPVLLPSAGIPTLTSASVQPIVSWDAHPEASVEYLSLIAMPLALVTTSSDGVIQLWYLGGTPIGCLVSPSAIARAGGPASGAAEASQQGIEFAVEDELTTASSRKEVSSRSFHKPDAESASSPPPPPQQEHQQQSVAKKPKRERTIVINEEPPAPTPLISFLTEFQFGELTAGEGDGDGDSDDEDEVADRKDITSGRAFEKYLHRYNDLPPPYGYSDVSSRKMTAYMLGSILRTNNTADEGASAGADEVETDGGSKKLLRSLSTVPASIPVDPRRRSQRQSVATDATTSPTAVEELTLAQKISAIKRKEAIAILDEHAITTGDTSHQRNESPSSMPAFGAHSTTPPAYMAKDKLLRLHDRPLQCKYTPHEDLTDAMYGSAQEFQSFVKHALYAAQQSTSHALVASSSIASMRRQPSTIHNGKLRRLPSVADHQLASAESMMPRSRALPSHMFPSSLRRSTTSLSYHHDEDAALIAMRSRSVMDVKSGHSSSPPPAHYGRSSNKVVSSPKRSAVAMSVLSPSRLAHGATDDLRTMGEETAYRYHSELYRPVALPPIRKTPGAGVSMFTKKSEELSELPGLMMHVTQSNSLSPLPRMTPHMSISSTPDVLAPQARLLAPVTKS